MKYAWKFTMTTDAGPCWDMRQEGRLVAYARRAKESGWFVRISELNPAFTDEKIYIEEELFPPTFMTFMLEMHKNETSNH